MHLEEQRLGAAPARCESVDVGAATLACLVVEPDASAPARGVALCVHGFPDGARSFRLQAPALAAAGFRVVSPWLRGYAPSSLARDDRYDPLALADDLCALAAHYSPQAPCVLIGHDWGAIASYVAVARAPERFARLVTVAVPQLAAARVRWAAPAQLRRSWYIGLFQLRGLAEAWVRRDDFAFIDRLWRAWSPGFTPPPEELAAVKASFAAPERLRAVLGYYRATLSPTFLRSPERRLLRARTALPSLYVHGSDDGCMGVELVRGVEAAYDAPISVVQVPGAGHFVHQERPDRFNRELIHFLGLRFGDDRPIQGS
jgi:pimeloyl-ACP methyl ester carboxylesterase